MSALKDANDSQSYRQIRISLSEWGSAPFPSRHRLNDLTQMLVAASSRKRESYANLCHTRFDAAELFEFVEEPLDLIALGIDPCAEGEAGLAVRF